MTLVVWALAWLMAIAAVALWSAPWWMGGAWLVAASPAVFALLGRKAALVVAVAALLAFGGGWRFAQWLDRPAPDLAQYLDRTVEIEAVVDAEPDPGLTTASYSVRVERIQQEGAWRATNGRARVSLNQYADYRPGTRLNLKGKLETPPRFPDFDYRAYLARQDVVATMFLPKVEVVSLPGQWNLRHRIADLRLALDRGLQRSLPEPQASLGGGIAFGRDANLPDAVYDDFRTAGLAHLVAVSGSNVSLVAGMAFIVVVPLVGRRKATVPAALLVVLYVVVAGLSASVVRAGVMAAVFLTGAALGRQQSALTALGFAAIAMTAIQPQAAVDLGFQLSMSATAGLIVFTPWVHHGLRWLARHGRVEPFVPDLALQAAALSLSATFAALPIAWVTFGRVSLIGVAANAVAEPLFVMAFLFSGLTALAGNLWGPAGSALGLAAYYPLALLLWVARTLANVPFAAIDVPRTSGTIALLAYLVIGLAAWPAYRFLVPALPFERHSRHVKTVRGLSLAAACGGLVMAVVPIGLVPLGGPGTLEVTVLNVGQGDAILITTPHGRRYLVDGGPSGIELARELGAVLPHWERSLDGIFLTHPQEDHIGGLPEALARYHIAAAFDTGISAETPTYRAYLSGASHREQPTRGAAFEADGVRFEVLWPPADSPTDDVNATSLVVRIRHGASTVLLTGDIDAAAQRELMATTSVAANVLKVPHHGSKTNAADFLAAVGPQVALISVGADNSFGHPAPETLAALGSARILRTDLSGRIAVSSDGSRLTIRTQR